MRTRSQSRWRSGEPTVAELAARYLKEYAEELHRDGVPPKDREARRAGAGESPARGVRREDVRDLHYAMRATPVMAKRTLDLLSRTFNMAESWGLLSAGSNPCRGQTKCRASGS